MKQAVSQEAQRQYLVRAGELMLKAFYREYDKNPIGSHTEYWRGQFTCWRSMLSVFFGEAETQEMVEVVSENTKLAIPHGGELAPDGVGYLGWDSGCHMAIGRLE